MIKSFAHKGLENFYYTGSKAKITAAHAQKLGRILDYLNAATCPEDMDLPGYGLHELSPSGLFKGKPGHFAVTVNGNWRVTFTFQGEDAIVVDYMDYH